MGRSTSRRQRDRLSWRLRSNRLIQEVCAVEGVALLGHEARVADNASEFFLAGPMMRTGGGDDVLLDHNAADVVAAETESQLAGLQALRYPGALHILEIVEVDA